MRSAGVKRSGVLPSGIKVSYRGDMKHQAEGFGNLGLALPAGIFFVCMIMVARYDSYVESFVALCFILVAMIGALLALALTMKSLSIISIPGIIMLEDKNAILIDDCANQLRAERRHHGFHALLEAGQTRLRPILMATVAVVFGMKPIALSASSGSEWKSGLAWVLIGG